MSVRTDGSRPRHGCATFFVVGSIVFALGVAAHLLYRNYEVEIFITLLALGALLFALRNWLRPAAWSESSTTVPPRPLASVVAGGPVATMGTVRAPESPPIIPFSSGACAWSRVRVIVDGILVADVRTSDIVVLEDGAGAAVEVQLEGAELRTKSMRRSSTAELPIREVLEWLDQRGLARGRTGVDLIVDWLPLREIIFVSGRVEAIDGPVSTSAGAYRGSERATLRIVADGAQKVRVTSDGRTE